MALDFPNNLANDTAADAVEVQQNFEYAEQYINQNLIHRDGSVAMDGALTLANDPTQDMQAATKGYADALIPVGVMMPYLGQTAPAGWMLCQGQTLSTSAEPELFGVLGYRYGGSGSSFSLPDMRHRFPIGMDSTIAEVNATGKEGGTTTVPTPKHSHTINHDHGEFASGSNNTDHVHSIAHDHSAITNEGGGSDLTVTTAVRRNSTPGATTSFMAASATGESVAHDDNPVVSVNLPSFAGNSGVNTTDHTHDVDVPLFNGSSGETGTTGATMRPEFVVVNYIIKVTSP